ncbi:hypothetical protein Y032_0301g1832 [Ancylostoma ceylanicum]|uniref:Uncharacterized protein n=1 Tax=Ancylostoma ceylanicum TaxID=53326 RepID=A0A016S3P4_9BILA|nr:hypothetical protein Y032_0301g1832 [Ancylostoma ceylanicum]
MAIMGRMPIDCDAPLIITPLSSGVSSFTLSMCRPPAVVAIVTAAGDRGERHDRWRTLGILKQFRGRNPGKYRSERVRVRVKTSVRSFPPENYPGLGRYRAARMSFHSYQPEKHPRLGRNEAATCGGLSPFRPNQVIADPALSQHKRAISHQKWEKSLFARSSHDFAILLLSLSSTIDGTRTNLAVITLESLLLYPLGHPCCWTLSFR